jgi:hypothetical protein
MWGKNIGSLNVYTRNAVLAPLKQKWQKIGQVGDFYERVDIQMFESQPFQVNIIAHKMQKL